MNAAAKAGRGSLQGSRGFDKGCKCSDRRLGYINLVEGFQNVYLGRISTILHRRVPVHQWLKMPPFLGRDVFESECSV